MEWRWQPRAEEWSALIALARGATQTQPRNAAAWLSLAKLIASGGREDEAIAALEEAVEHLPSEPSVHLELALALRVAGRFEAALEQAEAVLSLQPDLGAAQVLRFMLLAKLGRYESAGKVVEDAAAADPCEPYLFEYWWAQATGPDDLERLIGRCDVALSEKAYCANAVYFKAMALTRLGRAEAARDVLKCDAAVSAPPLPVGFDGKKAFLAALAAEVRGHPTLQPSPRGKATREGWQTGRLQESKSPALRSIVQLIREAVAEYGSDKPGGKLKLAVWATLCGPEGRQESHRHPDGWISGVYYVEAPRRPTGEYAGEFILGAVPDDTVPPWGLRRIEPVPGRLVMFPSCVPHATEPSGLQGDRISIAFDVIPVPT